MILWPQLGRGGVAMWWAPLKSTTFLTPPLSYVYFFNPSNIILLSGIINIIRGVQHYFGASFFAPFQHIKIFLASLDLSARPLM